MYKKILKYLILVVFFISIQMFSQQDPQYTNYMYNLGIINPAYTSADNGFLSLGALYRSQWSGIEGAPITKTFFARMPFNEKITSGLSIVQDDIGNTTKETNIYADFAYKLKVNDNSNISFGLKAGVSMLDVNFSDITTESNDNSDVAFMNSIDKSFFNAGIGVFYVYDNAYLSFSTTNLLKNKYLDSSDTVSALGSEEIHIYLVGGYVFNYNTKLKIKPSFLIRQTSSSPISYDISLNALYLDKFELGVSYRFEDSISALINIEVLPYTKIGYAYDYTLSDLKEFNTGSHELILLYDLNLLDLGKGFRKSPRYF